MLSALLNTFLGSWWSGSQEVGTDVLVLHPTPAAAEVVAGFRGGQDLKMKVVAAGETVGQVLERLNVYRGPDQILKRVWSTDTGLELPNNTVVQRTLVVEVRPESREVA